MLADPANCPNRSQIIILQDVSMHVKRLLVPRLAISSTGSTSRNVHYGDFKIGIRGQNITSLAPRSTPTITLRVKLGFLTSSLTTCGRITVVNAMAWKTAVARFPKATVGCNDSGTINKLPQFMQLVFTNGHKK